MGTELLPKLMLLGHCNRLCVGDSTLLVLAETDRIKVVNNMPWVWGGQFLTMVRIPLIFLLLCMWAARTLVAARDRSSYSTSPSEQARERQSARH